MRFHLSRMAAVLTLGVASVIVAAFSIGAYVNSSTLYDKVIDATRAHAQAQAETIRIALEHQMVEKDRSVIDSMVRSFATDPLVDAVMILNWSGELKYSSQPDGTELELDILSPTCQACHNQPPDKRVRSKLIDTEEGEILRIATPIRNREPCHDCHPAERANNGLLLVDMNVGQLKRKLDVDIRNMVMFSGLLALLAMAGISLIIRLAFLRRLKRFEKVARSIAAGDFQKRLPVKGDDTLAWFARQFNRMTDSVMQLLEDVKQHSRQLERVIGAMSDGIMVLTPEGRVVALNDALLERVGKKRKEVVGALCYEAMGEFCAGEAPCSIRPCLSGGGRASRVIQRTTADGEIRHEEVQASPVVSSDGTVEYVVECWRDITSRRAAEAQLADSHRLASLGMLASGFSHELNTPLATILTCLEGISRTAGEDTVDTEYLQERAHVATEQLMRCRVITQQFLRLARGEATGEDLIDLHAALPAMVRLVEPTARESKVKVRAETCPENVFVRVCEAEIHQVLLNLMLNAVQACEEGGEVVVECHVGSRVEVRIRDNGRGITQAEQQRILEPFYSRREGGTGLGLFISVQLIRKWGGELLVESQPGQGSTFTITFPLGTDKPDERRT